MCVCVWRRRGQWIVQDHHFLCLSSSTPCPTSPSNPPLPSNPATPNHRPNPKPLQTLTHPPGQKNKHAEKGWQAQTFSYLTQIKSILIKSNQFPALSSSKVSRCGAYSNPRGHQQHRSKQLTAGKECPEAKDDCVNFSTKAWRISGHHQ